MCLIPERANYEDLGAKARFQKISNYCQAYLTQKNKLVAYQNIFIMPKTNAISGKKVWEVRVLNTI